MFFFLSLICFSLTQSQVNVHVDVQISDISPTGFKLIYAVLGIQGTQNLYYGITNPGVPITGADLENGNNQLLCTGNYAVSDSLTHEQAINCAMNAGSSYVLWVGLSDLNGQNVQLASGGSQFQVTSASTVAIVLGAISETGFQLSYTISGHSENGKMYYAVAPFGTTLTSKDILSGVNTVCNGALPQVDDLPKQVDISCPLTGGQIYTIAIALDVDGQGTGLAEAGSQSFSVVKSPSPASPSSSSTSTSSSSTSTATAPANINLEIKDVNQDGLTLAYSLSGLNAGGQVYYSITNAGTALTAQDVYGGAGIASGHFEQIDQLQHEIPVAVKLDSGSQYLLYLAVTSDANGNGLQLTGPAAPFSYIAAPIVTSVTVNIADFTTAGFGLNYQLAGPAPNGYLYWAVGNTLLTPEEVVTGASPSILCSGAYPQDGLQHNEQISCNLDSSTTPYYVYLVSDTDGNGSNPTLLYGGDDIYAQAPVISCTDAVECSGNGTAESLSGGTVCKCTCNEGFTGNGCAQKAPKNTEMRISLDGDITTQGYTWSYDLTEPSIGGKIYWVTTPSDIDTMTPDEIADKTNSMGPGCAGAETQLDEEEHAVIVRCTLQPGGTYKLFIATDEDGDRLNNRAVTPNGQNLLVSELFPEVLASVVPDTLSCDGPQITYQVSNPDDDGKVYWLIQPQSGGIPTMDQVREVAVNDGPCSGSKLQTADSQTFLIPCQLKPDVAYILWLAYDLDGYGYQITQIRDPTTSHGGFKLLVKSEPVVVPQTPAPTPKPTLPPSKKPEIPPPEPVKPSEPVKPAEPVKPTEPEKPAPSAVRTVFYVRISQNVRIEDGRLPLIGALTVNQCALMTYKNAYCADYFQWNGALKRCECLQRFEGLGYEQGCGYFIYHLYGHRGAFIDDFDDWDDFPFFPTGTGLAGATGGVTGAAAIGSGVHLPGVMGAGTHFMYGKMLDLDDIEIRFTGACGMMNTDFDDWDKVRERGLLFPTANLLQGGTVFPNGLGGIVPQNVAPNTVYPHGILPGMGMYGMYGFDMDDDDMFPGYGAFGGAELPLPGRITVALDSKGSNSKLIRFTYQISQGFQGVKLYYLLTDKMHVSMPEIRLGIKKACTTCHGVITLNDFNQHTFALQTNLKSGHYGLWFVGEVRPEPQVSQLLMVLPYGLYFNIGDSAIKFSFLFSNVKCEDEEDAFSMAFSKTAEDCAYLASQNDWCSTMFYFNTRTNVCACKPRTIGHCTFESAAGVNVYRIDAIGKKSTGKLDHISIIPAGASRHQQGVIEAEDSLPIILDTKPTESHDIFRENWWLLALFPILALIVFMGIKMYTQKKRTDPIAEYLVDLDEIDRYSSRYEECPEQV